MIGRPCHRLLQVVPEVQRDQADQRGPGHHHDQPDLGALSRPKKTTEFPVHISLVRNSWTEEEEPVLANFLWERQTHRGSFLSSRTRRTLRTRSARQANWASCAGRTSFARRTLKEAESEKHFFFFLNPLLSFLPQSFVSLHTNTPRRWWQWRVPLRHSRKRATWFRGKQIDTRSRLHTYTHTNTHKKKEPLLKAGNWNGGWRQPAFKFK